MRKIEPVPNDFFFRALKSPTSINTCLDEMEEFKGRDIAFVSDWLTKKVFKRSLLKMTGAEDNCSLVGYDRQILR